MPTVLPFVFAPEDEKQFFAFLAPFELTLYPDRVPPDWDAPRAEAGLVPALTEPAYYLAAEKLAPVVVLPVKRGPDKGSLSIVETESPVLHYERSFFDEDGELRSGRLWTELNLTGDKQSSDVFPDAFRRMVERIRDYLNTRCQRSEQPHSYALGPHAARLAKAGTVLRVAGRNGGVLKPYR